MLGDGASRGAKDEAVMTSVLHRVTVEPEAGCAALPTSPALSLNVRKRRSLTIRHL